MNSIPDWSGSKTIILYFLKKEKKKDRVLKIFSKTIILCFLKKEKKKDRVLKKFQFVNLTGGWCNVPKENSQVAFLFPSY